MTDKPDSPFDADRTKAAQSHPADCGPEYLSDELFHDVADTAKIPAEERIPDYRVYKYPLEIKDWQSITVPVGAEILSAQKQGGQLFLWAKVDRRAGPEQVSIVIHGTGHPMQPNLRFIDTVQMRDGALVLHIFEEMTR